MLIELVIADFAIIDHVRLQFSPAFNVLTGETGAGKSIIIDALNTLRGERADTSFVRTGCAQARVEGIFTIGARPDLIPLLQEYGLYEEGEDQLILSREISAASGRSVARVNGRAVSLSVLREIGGRLVDIHGQHESLSLFNVRTHLEMLDRYGGLLPLRAEVARLAGGLEEVRQRLEQLRRQEGRRQERIDELQYMIDELTAAKLRPGEEDDLARERGVLQNAAKITALAETAYSLLKGGEAGDRRRVNLPIIDSLDEVASIIGELQRFDPTIGELHEQLLDLRYRLDDVVAALRDYRDTLEFEPGRLEEIEDRLALLHDLTRKYRAENSDALIGLIEEAQAELEVLQHSSEHLAGLQAEEARLRVELGRTAAALSEQRRRAGEELAQRIVQSMADLAMPHVRFEVHISHTPDPQGVVLGSSEPVAFDRTGADKVEFLLSPNPGEPLKALAKIASGGESSRLLLAMKSILSAADTIPTLVFDEIDVGVGGRSGQVVGEKMWGLTSDHQVLCITHLPQIAAFADAHYSITKRISGDRTQTIVRPLGWEERVSELAAMLDGTPVSEASRRSAEEMLARAEAIKQQAARQHKAEHIVGDCSFAATTDNN
ncbi:MAG: DNA repair protein RecN [Herpetosiphonaceae bacterium]|nr:MAG: DNA repair protein RecN [Herpetosiphonaceae bacterium]